MKKVCSLIGGALVLSFLAQFGMAEEAFVPNPLVAIYEGESYGGKDDAKCVVRIAGARNGAFSGQAVVCLKASGKGPEAKASELKHKDGKSAIPAKAVEVRYALPTGTNGPKGKLPFDALGEKPREEGTVHPVWVTVHVPEEAPPGEYEGKLSVAGREVPVKLSVADWTLPKPIDYQTWADFIESPESVAMRYGVELWSDRHWELIGKSFDRMAQVGNKTVYILLQCQTNLGNEQSMVRWIKTGEKKIAASAEAMAAYKDYCAQRGGGPVAETEPEFKHDFAIAEKYLDLYVERVGKPKAVILYFFEMMNGGNGEKGGQRGVPVTLYDPETKQVST